RHYPIRILFFYFLLAFLEIVFSIFETILTQSNKIVIFIDQVLIICNYSFLGWFILENLRGIKAPNQKLFLRSANFIFYLFYLFSIFTISYEILFFEKFVFFFPCLGLFILCIIYFLNIFKILPNDPFWLNYGFWIISGIFLFTTIMIPVSFISHSSLGFSNNNKELLNVLYMMGYIVLYCFMIKGI